MREYKFRAKLKDKDKWVYGTGIVKVKRNCYETDEIELIKYVDYDELDYYIPCYMTEDVIPETVGQFTGLHDKNGKEIYEGDIVNCQTKYGKAKAIIKFIDGKFVAYWDSKITHPKNGHHIACYDINKKFEVIGNIYDNKELLNETN